MMLPRSTSGTSLLTILRARPSAMAVLPTPGSPTNKRIVLLAAAENLDGAVHLGVAADQRIDPARLGLLIQVDAIGFQRLGALLVRSSRLLPPRRRRRARVWAGVMPGRLAMPWLI